MDHSALFSGQWAGIQVASIGSLFMLERDGVTSPGGGVAAASLAAQAWGAKSFAISRVGMDRLGREVVDLLKAAGVDVAAVQTDPDLVTARWLERGGKNARIEPYAAFDNLQWDADIEALARSAEVIVVDACGRRHGQTRSSSDRMLIGAPSAVRVIDLVTRPPSDAASLNREHVGQAMELCTVFVVDATALKTLLPAAPQPIDAAKRLYDMTRQAAVVLIPTDRDEGCVVTARGSEPLPRRAPESANSTARVAVAAGLALVAGSPLHEVLRQV